MKTTVAEALMIMSPVLGLKLPDHRHEALTYLNKFRNYLYREFDELKSLDYEICVDVCRFAEKCDGDACSHYYGFTLPSGMCNLIGAWERRDPVNLNSEWHEVHNGRLINGDAGLKVVPIVGDFPTQIDVDAGSSLKMKAFNQQDNGKIVRIKAKMSDMSTKTLEFELVSGGFAEITEPVCSILSVVTPRDLCGNVELYQRENNLLLSRYEPNQHVRSYTRYKIISDCNSPCLKLRGNREYFPVCDDADIVELADVEILESAASYFRYKNSHNNKEIQRSLIDRQDMESGIKSIIDKKRGRNHQDGSLINNRPSNRNRRALPGRRGCRRRNRSSRLCLKDDVRCLIRLGATAQKPLLCPPAATRSWSFAARVAVRWTRCS